MIETILTGFFILLLRHHELDVFVPNPVSRDDSGNFVSIFHYIQNNYKTVTLETTASNFNYSSRQMSRIVKE